MTFQLDLSQIICEINFDFEQPQVKMLGRGVPGKMWKSRIPIHTLKVTPKVNTTPHINSHNIITLDFEQFGQKSHRAQTPLPGSRGSKVDFMPYTKVTFYVVACRDDSSGKFADMTLIYSIRSFPMMAKILSYQRI